MPPCPFKWLIVTVFIIIAADITVAVDLTRCRCFPGDTCWPSNDDWAHFNASVNGQLVATVPIATPCHDPSFDAGQCKALQDNWTEPSLQ